MEYKTHKPVPTFEMDKILMKYALKNTGEKAATKKGGSSFDM